jgi:hypothetical protein
MFDAGASAARQLDVAGAGHGPPSPVRALELRAEASVRPSA